MMDFRAQQERTTKNRYSRQKTAIWSSTSRAATSCFGASVSNSTLATARTPGRRITSPRGLMALWWVQLVTELWWNKRPKSSTSRIPSVGLTPLPVYDWSSWSSVYRLVRGESFLPSCVHMWLRKLSDASVARHTAVRGIRHFGIIRARMFLCL